MTKMLANLVILSSASGYILYSNVINDNASKNNDENKEMLKQYLDLQAQDRQPLQKLKTCSKL